MVFQGLQCVKICDNLALERQDMEETPLEAIPALGPTRRKINRRFIYLVLTILAIIIVFVAYKSFGSSNKSVNQNSAMISPTASPTESPTSSPSASPLPTSEASPTPSSVDKATGLDRSKLSITIENGSGEAGVAGKASDYLKGLGYVISSTGNADNFDYTNVTIQVKANKSDFLALLKKDLGFNYTIDKATSDLADSFSTDALVIIGK